jgi:hypothetical protein
MDRSILLRSISTVTTPAAFTQDDKSLLEEIAQIIGEYVEGIR